MTERPILFQGAMVRAILAGTKTQTRRAWRNSPPPGVPVGWVPGETKQPYGWPGDRLWVREAFRILDCWNRDSPVKVGELCLNAGYSRPWAPTQYEADGARVNWMSVGTIPGVPTPGKLRPGIHMPRWANRILLEVTGVRVERLQTISEADARAEGIAELVPSAKRAEGLTPAALAFAAAATVDDMPRASRRRFLQGALAAALGFVASPSRPWEVVPARMERAPTGRQLYALLWESINGSGSWDTNPWVWVVEFRRVTP
jgi:hypothetical protein